MTDLHPRREIDANDVAGFLRRHPEFLADFPDLAMNLKLPREQGASTSLASYQLEVLRDKTRALTRRLQELIEVAQENEQLMSASAWLHAVADACRIIGRHAVARGRNLDRRLSHRFRAHGAVWLRLKGFMPTGCG